MVTLYFMSQWSLCALLLRNRVLIIRIKSISLHRLSGSLTFEKRLGITGINSVPEKYPFFHVMVAMREPQRFYEALWLKALCILI